jgi:lipopolysaccharide/colanic/teichoic acid biosynthesis glycosyltransferase
MRLDTLGSASERTAVADVAADSSDFRPAGATTSSVVGKYRQLASASDTATAAWRSPWFLRFESERRVLRGRAYEVAKRVMDLGVVVLTLPVLAPLFAACWIAVKLESPRAPVLFVQLRTGREGNRFRMFKFRTMVPDAEHLKSSLAAKNKLQWPDFKVEDDPRITRTGRFLRKSSLDELPQILNVIRGEMSLVGPRPTSFGIETYQEWHKARLAAIPGITGLWQVVGRGEMEFDDRVRLDLFYIERQSLLLDFAILLLTAGAVVRRRGAY